MEFQATEEFARRLDAEDPLRLFRDAFHIPQRPDGTPVIYFCGHSLGLQPKAVRGLIEQELDAWAKLGVEGHFRGKHPWYSYHEQFRQSAARLVGAKPGEVVMMNSLTVNLHLMLATFYQPTNGRFKILIDAPAFPSDLYALQTQILHHGLKPSKALAHLRAKRGEAAIRTENIRKFFAEQGDAIAVAFLNPVNFVTGYLLDVQRVTAAAQERGCIVGLNLAHAAGNVPLSLHDWGVDFAVWCNYKYVNAGPGAVGGCFVHEKHGNNPALPRLAGWWGTNPATRFEMDNLGDFVPQAGADGWQVSNPPILSMAPLKAALDLFDEATMPALRAKSKSLTGFLVFLLNKISPALLQVITPERRGSALSMEVHKEPRELVEKLKRKGIVCDFRPPNVIRAAPVPLYNTHEEVWRFAKNLAGLLGGT
jgi:kynureninase